jgi:hypothetical protein
VCGICRMPFDGCPPDGKFPGDDSPVVWGTCTHAFHLQCINRWRRGGADALLACWLPAVWLGGWQRPHMTPSQLLARMETACQLPAKADSSCNPAVDRRSALCPRRCRRWLQSQTEQKCPFCRRSWEFKQAVVGGEDSDT